VRETLGFHEVDVAIARRFSLRGAVTSPIRVFNIAEMGIQSEAFLGRIGRSFQDLPFDPYDPAAAAEELVKKRSPDAYHQHEAEWISYWDELGDLQYTNPVAGPQFWNQRVSEEVQVTLGGLRPHRRRSCFQYLATPHSSSRYLWQLRELGNPPFKQSVSDLRARPRRFATAPAAVYRDVDILLFAGFACQMARQAASVIATAMKVTLHQVLTYANSPAGNDPAPEGPHQDGSPFIVSALVMQRCNVVGGVSRVYYAGKDVLALEHELAPGYGIFQSDTHGRYFHHVSTIYPADPARVAYRSIIGLDIDFVSEDAPILGSLRSS